MTTLEQIRTAPAAAACRPWQRHVLSQEAWRGMVAALARESIVLHGLWADTAQVHVLLRQGGDIVVASVPVEAGRYPALSLVRPEAARFERMIGDLRGHAAEGGTDDRPWLDHGRWPLAHPQSPRPGLPGGTVEPPAFPALEESGLMQVPLGPIRGLVDEPAHLRLAVEGEVIRRAEARLGYAHKGTLALLYGKSPRAAARFIARLAAEATVAHSLAFARAAEVALNTPAPPRAVALRAAMLEQERIAGHLDDLGRLAEAAGLPSLHAAAARQREQCLRAAEAAFGHRLMMDVVAPGGVASDITPDGIALLRRCIDALAASLPGLHRQTEALLARLQGLAAMPTGGLFDARGFDPLYGTGPGTDELPLWPVPTMTSTSGGIQGGAAPRQSDAAFRCRTWLADLDDSLHRLGNLLAALPDGAVAVTLPAESGEGLASAQSVRGAVWHWLRLDHGQIAAAFPLDPGWTLWPLAEAAMTGHSVEEAAMIRLSCGLPVSGLDL